MDAKLRELVDRLTAVYNPERIYLFGSRAWGSPHDDSDYDVLVEVANSSLVPHRRPVAGYIELYGFGAPVDLLVYTTDELNARKEYPGRIVTKAVREGLIIYARS